MREDVFGAPLDEGTQLELQRLIDKFEWAVCDPASVAACTQAHMDCPDRVAFNPYRPPRGDEARRQLENINIAEWGAIMLKEVRDDDDDDDDFSNVHSDDAANLSPPLVLRGHSIRFASPLTSQHVLVVAHSDSGSELDDDGSPADDPRRAGSTTTPATTTSSEAASHRHGQQEGPEGHPRRIAAPVEEPSADAVLDQLAHLLLAAAAMGHEDDAAAPATPAAIPAAEAVAPREVLQRRRLVQRTESGRDADVV